jgi:hypothetical protein
MGFIGDHQIQINPASRHLRRHHRDVDGCFRAQLRAHAILAEQDAFSPNTLATLDVAYKPLGRFSESPSVAGKALRAYMRLVREIRVSC